MLRRIFTAASLLALLGLTVVPPTAACPLAPEAPHGCCSKPELGPTPSDSSSCCGDTGMVAPPGNPVRAGSGGRCDCVHAPSAPTATLVGTPTSSDVQHGPVASASSPTIVAQAEIFDHPTDRASLIDRHPPIFLLTCSFLT